MNKKFEDLMKPDFSRRLVSPVEDPPDALRWVHLLSAVFFTMFCTVMSEPETWGDGLVCFMLWGMIFGPVIFLMTSGFAVMCGGKGSWWVSLSFLVLLVCICGYGLFCRFGFGWLF